MSAPSTLLVATDLSENARAAARWARDYRRSGATRIVVCHVTDVRFGSWVSGEYEGLHDEAVTRRARERVRKWYGDAVGEAPSEVEVRFGAAAEQLEGAVKEWDADRLVVARSGKSNWERFWLGSTARALAADPPCELAIVHPEHTSLEIDAVGVGCDFSADADRAVAAGARLAGRLGARLELVHASERLETPAIDDEDLPESLRRADSSTEAAAQMDALVDRLEENLEGLEVRRHLVETEGPPAEGLVEFARSQNLEVMVLGRSGHSRFAAAVFGSVLNRALDALETTLIVTPPAGSTEVASE